MLASTILPSGRIVHKHKAYNRVKVTNMRRRFRGWRVRLSCSVAIVALLLTATYGMVHENGSQVLHSPKTVAGVSFTTERSLYTASQTPTLVLSFQHRPTTQAGFLTTLFGMPDVYALSSPDIQVDYDGRRANVGTNMTAQDGNFLVTLSPDDTLQPGTYTVLASGETTDGQDFSQKASFAWGVLALNTSKSIYAPGQTVSLQMGVLDSDGHTICAAPLLLTITDPKGNQQDVTYQDSSACHGDGYTSTPDYTASYATDGVGNYKVVLSIAKDSDYSITDNFEVRATVPFDITRNSVTRIYPIHTYGMGVGVIANQNFSGMATETISSAKFTIPSQQGATVSTTDGKTTISWPVNWKQGNSYELSYQYLAPPVSPASYTMGPLKLTDASGQTVFQETRGWQVVADAAITLVKQTEVNVTTAASSNSTSVTSTAGDTLILLLASSGAGVTGALSSVTDSASNSWVYASTTPNQNPPSNFATSTSSNVGIAYIANANAITSITVNMMNSSNSFSYDLLEFSDIDPTHPVAQSASNDNETAATSHTTPSLAVSTCDNPSTSQLLRGGDYFCTSPTNLVVGLVNSGHQTGSPAYTLTTGGFTETTAMVPVTAGDQAQGAYGVVSSSATYSINWTDSVSKKDSTAIMAFQQAGNTSGGDQQNFFWSH
jgi:hypothetical protein